MTKSKGRISRLMLWLLAAIVSVGLTVLFFFPASWMALLVERQTGGRFTLGDPQGTLWQGSAFIGAAPSGRDPVTPLVPGRFAWQLSPLVLIGKTQLTLENPTVMPQPVTIDGGWNQWQVSSASIALPAERLAGLGAPLNTIQPSGQMRLKWSPLQVVHQNNAVTIHGRMGLEMQDMSSRLSPIKPLGSYVMEFDWQGQRAPITLRTVDGPMLLSGSGVLANGRLQFSGKAEAAEGQEDRLANLLNLLGQRRREGNKTVIALEFK